MSDRIEADYVLETAADPQAVAATIAGEQSSGTFRPVPGETAELKARAAARVEAINVFDTRPVPALPGATGGGPVPRCHMTLSWPLDNIGPDLPNLMATVAGNLFELQDVAGLRLCAIRLPDAFRNRYPGPRFGIDGTRRLSGIETGPLIGTIIKPSVGLSAEGTAELVGTLARAGIDFIKDDELQANGPNCPFEDRARAVMRVLNDHAERTGKKVMYAFNLTGEIDEMRARHDLVLELGGTCVMASLNSVGLSGMIALGRHTELPIHAHRNGWGYLNRHPALGWDYPAWATFWRLAGADHMHVNGLDNKFSEDNDSVISSAKSCLTPIFADSPCLSMPVFSSGQTVMQADETYRRLGSADLIYTAGGGVMAHPGGPAEGVESLRAAWNAAMAGVPLAQAAETDPALAQALASFGP